MEGAVVSVDAGAGVSKVSATTDKDGCLTRTENFEEFGSTFGIPITCGH